MSVSTFSKRTEIDFDECEHFLKANLDGSVIGLLVNGPSANSLLTQNQSPVTGVKNDQRNSLRGCLHGEAPALLVGLALPRGLDFTSPLHGKN